MENGKTELEKAKELIAKEEKLNEEKATVIYEKAIKEIYNLGYSIIPEGSFKGNNFEIRMTLIKNI